MKILFTGGGSGGHFYPIISIAAKIRELTSDKEKSVKLYFMSNTPFDQRLLDKYNIQFIKNSAGKARMYFSLLNFLDFFVTLFGTVTAFFRIFLIYPDVIVGKGGYASFPVLVSAFFFRIPVFIHESDTVPGRVNKWAGLVAARIGVSFPEAFKYFSEERTALTGIPVRPDLHIISKDDAREKLGLANDVKTILVIGGSLGAQVLNQVIIDMLPDLLQKYQIIHQTGKKNFKEIMDRVSVEFGKNTEIPRYKPFDYLNEEMQSVTYSACDIVISRAGASAISEISHLGLPSILVPINVTHGDHQRKNAFSYASSGAALVIDEANFTPHIIFSELERLFTDAEYYGNMSQAAKSFFKDDAAKAVAEEVLLLAKHE